MGIDKTIKSNKILLFLCGAVCLVAGIALILLWWPDVVSLFKAAGALFLALGGMVLLYMVKE
jgi:hypothetical protein